MEQNKQNEPMELSDDDLQAVAGGNNSDTGAIVTTGVAGTGLGAGAVGLYARSKIKGVKQEADISIQNIQAAARRRGVPPPSYEEATHIIR